MFRRSVGMSPTGVRSPRPYLGFRRTLSTAALALVALGSTGHRAFAQIQGWNFYGGAYSESSAAGSDGHRIYAIDHTTGAETVALNLDSYSLFTGKTIYGTNGLAYDASSDRVYFALSTASVSNAQPGSGGVYWWNRSNNTVGTLLSSFSSFSDDTTVNADNAAVYGGYYYFVQDQTEDSAPNLYRISLTSSTPAVERLNDFNGSSGRTYYDFGDIAIDSNGVIRGSARSRNTTNGTLFNMFFTANLNSANFTVAGYAETTSSTTVTAVYQPTYGWNSNGTLGSTLYAQNSGGSAGNGTGQFVVLNPGNGSETSVLFSNSGQRIYSDLTSAPLFQPVPAPPALVSLGIGMAVGLIHILGRKRRRRVNLGAARPTDVPA